MNFLSGKFPFSSVFLGLSIDSSLCSGLGVAAPLEGGTFDTRSCGPGSVVFSGDPSFLIVICPPAPLPPPRVIRVIGLPFPEALQLLWPSPSSTPQF